MSTYEPGTVALATVRNVPETRVVRVDYPTTPAWMSVAPPHPYGCVWHADSDVTDVRPLVVLDPENASDINDLVQHSDFYMPGQIITPLVKALQRGLRQRVKPPRIPEPQRCGAMVIAAQKGEDQGSERGWVRFRHGKTHCWIDHLEHVRSWDDLEAPELQECEVQS